MKKKLRVGNLFKFRFPIYFALIFVLISCEPVDNNLGINLFPPSDTILVYTDTLYNLETQLVESDPLFSSVFTLSPSPTKLYMLGALQDTITGLSKAEIVTQVAFSDLGHFGESPFIDSLTLWLYCDDIEGDTGQPMRILIHELTEDLEYEDIYFSDFDVTGLYNPVPLVEKEIILRPKSYNRFDIDNPEFLGRIREAAKDSIFSAYDTIHINSMQEIFKGFYITTELQAESNTIAKIGLASPGSRLGFQYNHDSLEVSTFTPDSASLYNLTFNQFYAQNLNIFHHDYTGTALDQMIDNPDAHSPVLYVQGMAGVNVEIAIPEFDSYLDSGAISINSARLVFEVIPESISGIWEDNYPFKLLLTNMVSDTTKQNIYDDLTSGGNFGFLSKSNSVSAFLPPLYQYKFNLGLHLQSVLTGEIENTKLLLTLNNPLSSAEIIKLWGSNSDQKGSLRLELVYTKF